MMDFSAASAALQNEILGPKDQLLLLLSSNGNLQHAIEKRFWMKSVTKSLGTLLSAFMRVVY
jgi:hypothetical protein